MTIEEFNAGFTEEPGYLDYGRIGPISVAALEESLALSHTLQRARHGSLDVFAEQDERVRRAAGALLRLPADHVVFQPNTSQGLMHALFGVTGEVLLSAGEFPSLPIAAVRAEEALHVARPRWLETDHGRVTPGAVREQLGDAVAVAVSLVDSRTGFVADLEGIRQVIGDRLLIVDAIQGVGVVDAAFEAADVVAFGGQKWLRSGWGTGVLGLSDRALEALTPVFSGFTGTVDDEVWGEVPPPAPSARAFRVSNPDPIAEGRLAAGIEEVSATGIGAIAAAVAERVSEVVDLADEFAVPVVSSRDERERAGIVVLEPADDQTTALTASLHNHGVTASTRQGRVRLSIHSATSSETVEMLRGAFVSFSSAAVY
ncbi:aminotransferase class V-fold PLP-dependent enzyme [Agromyces seonyuensis]|uniref:aminotransferase class V-fold PLP-dependent enzyme n=1 Tax=Agromyces seonyuensis TaxID=2662446 RepID=UPI0030145300